MHRAPALSLLALTVTATLTGCGSPGPGPEAALSEFFTRLGADDLAGACSLVDPRFTATMGTDCVTLLDVSYPAEDRRAMGTVTVDPAMIQRDLPEAASDIPPDQHDRLAFAYEDAFTWTGTAPEYDIVLLVDHGSTWLIASMANGGSFADHARSYFSDESGVPIDCALSPKSC